MSEVRVRYVGNKPSEVDHLYGTRIVWEFPGDVKPVPVEAWNTGLSKHPDVWELVVDGPSPEELKAEADRVEAERLAAERAEQAEKDRQAAEDQARAEAARAAEDAAAAEAARIEAQRLADQKAEPAAGGLADAVVATETTAPSPEAVATTTTAPVDLDTMNTEALRKYAAEKGYAVDLSQKAKDLRPAIRAIEAGA